MWTVLEQFRNKKHSLVEQHRTGDILSLLSMSNNGNESGLFRLAVVQCRGNALLPDRFSRLKELIREAAQGGGQVVLLPELIFHDYFCIEENIRHFDLAHGLDSAPVQELQALTQELKIALVLPFFEKRAAGVRAEIFGCMLHKIVLPTGVERSGNDIDLGIQCVTHEMVTSGGSW